MCVFVCVCVCVCERERERENLSLCLYLYNILLFQHIYVQLHMSPSIYLSIYLVILKKHSRGKIFPISL